MTTSLALRLTTFAAVLLTAAGCSSGAGTSAGDGAESAAPGGASATVEMTGSEYAPSALEVDSGTTVTWNNADSVPHTVTFDGAGPASSDQLDEGASFSATFDDAGEFAYHCTIHPEMAGTVTVS